MKTTDTPSIERLKERLAELLFEHAPMCGRENCLHTAAEIAPILIERLAALETLTPSAGEREPCRMCNGVGGVNEAQGEGVYVGLKCPQCFGFGSEEIVDLISDALDNSMGPDWSTRTGAKYVADALSDAGFARAALASPPPQPEQQDKLWPMCRRYGDEIIIRVPISAVPISAGIAWERRYGEHNIAVVDADTFANELIRELNKEAEDGTTMVHIMLDHACVNAVENGAEGLSDD